MLPQGARTILDWEPVEIDGEQTIEVEEAKEKLKELIELVGEGTEVVLTDGRVPLARLVSVAPAAAARVAGLHAGSATTAPDFDDPLPDGFWSSE